MCKIIERNEPNRYSKDPQYQSSKFSISIQAVFKKSQDSVYSVVRRTVPLLISAKDLECRCPKIKANKYVGNVCCCQSHTLTHTHTHSHGHIDCVVHTHERNTHSPWICYLRKQNFNLPISDRI